MLQCSTASVKLLREHKNQYLKDAIMMITFDQISASSSANLNTVKGLSTKTYVGFGKMLELNLASVRDLMNGIFTHIERLLAARDAQQFLALQTDQLEPLAARATSYGRHVYGIAVEASAEFAKTFEGKAAEGQKVLGQVVQEIVKNAPPGCESAVAVIQKALASSQSAMDSAQAVTRKALVLTANITAAVVSQD